MTRQEAYIAELSQLLFYMTPWDKTEALKTVNKLFEEAENEAELLNELGTPMKLAVTLHRSYEPTPEPTPEELAAREAAAAAAAQAAEEEVLEEAAEEAEEIVEEGAEEAEEIDEEAAEEAEEIAEEAAEEAEEIVEEGAEEAEEIAEEAAEEAEEIDEEAAEEAEEIDVEAVEEAEEIVEETAEEAEEVIEEAADSVLEVIEEAVEAIEERVEAVMETIEEAVEAVLDPEEEDDCEEVSEVREERTPWVIEEGPEKDKIFAEIFNAATEAQSAVIIEEEPKKVTKRKPRYLLLIPYTIFALLVGIPGTIVFAAANLAVTAASMTSLVAMVYLVIFHLFAAVELSSKLIIFGLSIVMLSLAVILAVFALWFLHNATPSFPHFLREVAMKHCYREVEVK